MKISRDQEGIAHLVLIIVAIFVVGGIIAVMAYVNSHQSSIQTEVSNSQSQQAAQNNGAYPDLWAQAGLPEYPNGEVTDKRQGRDLADGVQVTVQTSDSLSVVSSFYETKLGNLGLIKQGNPPANELTYFAIFKNGNKQISLTLTKNDDGTTKIHGNYHE